MNYCLSERFALNRRYTCDSSLSRRLASAAFWPMGDTDADAAQLQNMLKNEAKGQAGDLIETSMTALFEREKVPVTRPDESGAWPYS